MITIKRKVNFLIIGLMVSCNSANVDPKISKTNDCQKFYNQDNIEFIPENKDAELIYLDFQNKKNNIDIIFIKTSYGYSVTQQVKRLSLNNKKGVILKNGIETEISESQINNFLNKFDSKNLKNLTINCPSYSSKQTISTLIYKNNGHILFSFSSNFDIIKLANADDGVEESFVKSFDKL